jgi:23S rRNA (pseudouridine1915-N3)-methyltransferase
MLMCKPAGAARGSAEERLMAREIVIVWAGRHRRGTWEELCAGYRRRIARFVPVREVAVKTAGSSGDPDRRRAEGAALLAALPDPVWTIALDGGGEALTTPELASRLARLRRDWPHAIAFLLGSDLGLDAATLAGARQVLSLGPLTLAHELARLVLYEQLYRVLCMDAGINYHRA